MTSKRIITAFTLIALTLGACKKADKVVPVPIGTGKDPAQAEKVSIDRFSEKAGMLMVRTATNGLPAANAAIDFDQPPFITKGLAPDGSAIEYYNFDVQSTTAAPIYVLMKDGVPVEGQLNIIDVIPGDKGYNDFWIVNTVAVPSDYVANSVTSLSEIMDNGYYINSTTTVVNCPVVPHGSVASKRFDGASAELTTGWYKGKTVYYFNFTEKNLETFSTGLVPTSPIYVTFRINPDQPNGGPASGFLTEIGTMQTHNVVATMPSDAMYSPLWSVNVYDNADFHLVSDLETVKLATVIEMPNEVTVNCPVVSY